MVSHLYKKKSKSLSLNKTSNNCIGFLISENRTTEANFNRKELVIAVAPEISRETREPRLEGIQPGAAPATAGDGSCGDPTGAPADCLAPVSRGSDPGTSVTAATEEQPRQPCWPVSLRHQHPHGPLRAFQPVYCVVDPGSHPAHWVQRRGNAALKLFRPEGWKVT